MPMPKNQMRVAALEAGASVYFTGRPCKSGHVADRFAIDSSCVECRRLFREGRKETAATYARVKRSVALVLDPEGTRAKWAEGNRARRVRDPEAVRASERKNGRLKRQRNPAAKLAEVRRRQAAKLQRTPPWADLMAIRRFYEARPPGHDIDHIYPLRGKNVSGLHVLENFQYLPSLENRLKGNRFDG